MCVVSWIAVALLITIVIVIALVGLAFDIIRTHDSPE
jgi:hypothetical protein